MKNDGYAHIDIANQISNSWNKDSILGIKEGIFGFTIRIKTKEKKELKKKFIKKNGDNYKRHNTRVSLIIHTYLLFRLLQEYGAKFEKAKVCNDAGSFSNLNRYYCKICKKMNERPITNIKPRRGKGRSLAHKLVNQTLKGRVPASMTIRKKDMKILYYLIREMIKL